MVTVQQRGLGKGLSALISENYTHPASSAKDAGSTAPGAGAAASNLPLAKLHAGVFQPRNRFDDIKLQELADSIRKNGVMQPVIVRPSTNYPGKYEIVAGERRWRAAKLAELDSIPVIVRDISDQQALELALVENIQRQDLSPLEEASGYQRLMEDFNYTQEALSQTVGKSRSHVANLLRLLALPEEVKEMLEQGKLTMGHARALLGVPNPVELAQDIVRKGLNVREVENASREAQGVAKKTRARGPARTHPGGSGYKDPDIVALEETLSENLGLKVSISDQGQRGEIVLAYESLSQLDEILQRLGGGVYSS